MSTLQTATATLPVPAEAVYAFLADLGNHRAFLEPRVQGFTGEPDRHGYLIEVMGMQMPQEFVVKERVPGRRVVLAPGARKLFDHELAFEVAPADTGCTLRLVDQADIPAMMAMMGAERILQGQLDESLARIQELAARGAI